LAAINQLAKSVNAMESDRDRLRAKLRSVLHHHRHFQDTDWAIRENVLQVLESVYEAPAPSDPVKQVAWLFAASTRLPKPKGGWEANEPQLLEERTKVAASLLRDHGLDAVFALANSVDGPGISAPH
jgi:hypothetical protein